MNTDRIEKQVELKAPVSRVWRALTNHDEFSAWFGVKLEGPFAAGKTVRGQITIKGYEHIPFEAVVQKVEPEHLFAFTWHPYAMDPTVDYSKEASTLVEFRLKSGHAGTTLTVVESGFDKLPDSRRALAFKSNDGGWTSQMKNIAKHLEAAG